MYNLNVLSFLGTNRTSAAAGLFDGLMNPFPRFSCMYCRSTPSSACDNGYSGPYGGSWPSCNSIARATPSRWGDSFAAFRGEKTSEYSLSASGSSPLLSVLLASRSSVLYSTSAYTLGPLRSLFRNALADSTFTACCTSWPTGRRNCHWL